MSVVEDIENWRERRREALSPYGMAGRFFRIASAEQRPFFSNWDVRLGYTDGTSELVDVVLAYTIGAALRANGDLREADVVDTAVRAARERNRLSNMAPA